MMNQASPTRRAGSHSLVATLFAGVIALAMSWFVYSPPAPWTSLEVAFRALGTLAGIIAISAVLRPQLHNDAKWLGLGLALGLGSMSIFSIGIGWLLCALLFALAIAMDKSDEPRITGLGLLMQAVGFASVLIVSLVL